MKAARVKGEIFCSRFQVAEISNKIFTLKEFVGKQNSLDISAFVGRSRSRDSQCVLKNRLITQSFTSCHAYALPGSGSSSETREVGIAHPTIIAINLLRRVSSSVFFSNLSHLLLQLGCVKYPKDTSLRLGLPTTTNRDGFIRPRSFPFQQPMPR